MAGVAIAVVNRSSSEGLSGHTNRRDSRDSVFDNCSGYQTYSKLTYLKAIVLPGEKEVSKNDDEQQVDKQQNISNSTKTSLRLQPAYT